MSITARHKKPGGFRKLVHSLETTHDSKREKILTLMRKEDPDFTGEVEKCLFKFDEFLNINDAILAEITGSLKEMRTLGLALYRYKQELFDKFNRCLSNPQKYELKECMEGFEHEKISKAQQISAQFLIIEKARSIEHDKNFVLKKYSQTYLD